MTDKTQDEKFNAADFLKELREVAFQANEECPPKHRRDPASGACLPMGSIDHTEETRSVNQDDGPEWRGEVTKTNTTFAEVAIDADEMDEPESCAEGTVFSFIRRRCISIEEAEGENDEAFEREEDGTPVEEEVVAAAPGVGGHLEVTLIQPGGRRDTVNHECPVNQIFDYKLRECIPLNKDTVMASDLSDEFKEAVATFARLATTSPDPIDGHIHVATLDENGNGVTSMSGFQYPHSHKVKAFEVIPETRKEEGTEYTSQHPGVAVPVEHHIEKMDASDESAAPITTTQRKGLSDSSFGVPGKRKFPLDTCARVRNAMSRFNQSKGLNPAEKASLRRKILSRAKACDIEVTNFAKATTDSEFAEVLREMIVAEEQKTQQRLDAYRADPSQGPCPPGMRWDAAALSCGHTRGLVNEVAQHVDIVKHQPEGRRDPVGFSCPDGWFFDFTNRRCLPLDPSSKPGSTTTKADEDDAAQRDLTSQPSGRPVRLPVDCPAGTIWNKDRNECIPLDSSKKTKSEEEDAAFPDFLKKKKGKPGDDKNGKKGKKDDKKGGFPFNFKKKGEEDDAAVHPVSGPMKKKKDGKKDDKKGGFPSFLFKKKGEDESADGHGQTTPNGTGNKKGPGCPEGQFMNPVTKKCMPRKGAFKGSAGREGLTPAPAGRVQHQSDCPPNTAWDAKSKVCRPIDSRMKNRPSGASPQPSKNVADDMSLAELIQQLDIIIRETKELSKERSRVLAKDLPNAAFPPSLISPTQRLLMHHTPDVEDPYDTASVDVSRLRNSLSRSFTVDGVFTQQAITDGMDHLVFHAREIVKERLEKKS